MNKRSEIGVFNKPKDNRVKIALVYPNKYKVGMSSLGFQTIYRLLNEKTFINCERVFLPENNYEKVCSIESKKRLQEFDFVFFSASYSADFINIFDLLKTASINAEREKRKHKLGPILGAGGSAVYMNPEPLAPVFDFFFLGESESFIEKLTLLLDSDPDAVKNRDYFLSTVQNLEGVYVPEHKRKRIVLVKENKLNDFVTCSALFTDDAEFGSVFMEEISRGCARGCRFCAIGFLGKPFRTRSNERLGFKDKNRGYKVGLLGAAISDHPKIKEISREVLESGSKLSYSSFRVDKIDSEIVDLIQNSRIKTFTIAPEAGSERLRNIIKKDLSNTALLESILKLAESGIKNLKLYFMIGLPLENGKDIDELIMITDKIAKIITKGRVTLSINPFIPKPHTPFQWFSMREKAYLESTFKKIKGSLKSKNIKIEPISIKDAEIDAIFSKGDRNLGDSLIDWSLKNLDLKKEILRIVKNSDCFIYKNIDLNTDLPWDYIDTGVEKAYLIKEYKKAISLV